MKKYIISPIVFFICVLLFHTFSVNFPLFIENFIDNTSVIIWEFLIVGYLIFALVYLVLEIILKKLNFKKFFLVGYIFLFFILYYIAAFLGSLLWLFIYNVPL